MKKNMFGLFISLAGFVFGFTVVKVSSAVMKTERDPAAINGKIFEISNLSADEIRNQIQKKIVIDPTDHGLKRLALNGFSSSICKTYSNIEVELVAEGVSVAGEPTVLKISQPCEASTKDPSELAAFLIPIDQLLKTKPSNMVYQFEGHKSVMTLVNSADEWPHTWVLRKVEFRNASGSDSKQAQFVRSPASAEDSAKPIVLEF